MKETAFNDVFDSQMTYRLLLDSMARPGKLQLFNNYDYKYLPANFNPHCLSILKTLCDNTTGFSTDLTDENLISYLELNTGSLFMQNDCAGYVIFNGKTFNNNFTGLNKGTIEFPEDSQTAILTVDELCSDETANDNSIKIRLSGPGIKNYADIFIKGLDMEYLVNFININKYFPLGIDLVIVDNNGRFTSIPRTTKLEIK